MFGKWLFTLLALLCSGLLSVHGQQINFRTYNIENGLVQSYVLCIVQDDLGYMWFGTADGLSKFDGHSFTNYSKKDGLPHNNIFEAYKDSRGKLWFGHRYGAVSIYNPDNDSFDIFTPFKDSVSHEIEEIFETSDGQMWIGTRKSGLWRWDGQTLLHDLDEQIIWSVMQDSKGRVWIGTDYFVYLYENGKFKKVFSLKASQIFDIIEDQFNNIWFSTSEDGIFFLPAEAANTGDSLTLQNAVKNYTKKDGIPNNYGYVIQEDFKGNIWFGTIGGGLSKFVPESGTNNQQGYFQIFNTQNGLSSDLVFEIYQDKENNLWFGTQNGGVNILPVNSDRFELYSQNEGLIHDNTWAILEDSQGDYWFKTDLGLTRATKSTKSQQFVKYRHFLTDEQLQYHTSAALIEDSEHNIWVGTTQGACYTKVGDSVFTCLTTKDGIQSDDIKSIIEDGNKQIWIGSYKGLSVYDLKTKAIKTYNRSDNLASVTVKTLFKDSKDRIWIGTENGFVMNYDGQQFRNIQYTDGATFEILCFTEDRNGDIWFTSQGGGVYQYNPSKMKVVKNYTMKDDLSSDNPYSIIYHNQSNIFIGTSAGIDRLNYNTGKIKHYGIQDGFMGIENNLGAVYKDQSNNLWFGTIRGVVKYNPSKDMENTNPPDTYIKNIRIDYRKAPFPENNEFSPNIKFITFDFAALSFTNPDQVYYQWKLYDFEKEWSPVTKQNYVTYSNLPTGKSYRFEVRARNSDGVWNEPTVYSFSINAPFYKRDWFIMLCVLVGIILIYLYIRIRTMNLVKERKLLSKEVENRTQELKTEKDKVEEINFQLVREKDKVEEVNRELEKLSIVARETDNGVIIADAKGVIEWINEGYQRLTGYTLEDLKSLHGKTLIESSVNAEMANIIQESTSKKSSVVFETNNITRDNKEIWLSSTLTPIFDKQGNLRKMVVIETDITERKKVMVELKAAKERAEKSEKIKEQFLANMSHEIRTPMNGIIGMLTLLSKTEVNQKQKKYLDTIKTSADNLLVIINDILDFSKIEAGKIQFEAVEFRLNHLIENIIRVVEIKANEKNLQVRMKMDPELPQVIIGDSVRLNQILINLMDNAVKFTEKGSVTLKATVQEQNEKAVVINFEIIDTGIGIPEEKLELIFQSFTQASSDTTRKYGGTGLGLTIVKQLVELQEGAISASSAENQGTTFKVTLKFQKSDKTVDDFVSETAHDESSEHLGQLKVLVVDDSELNQQVAYNLLIDWNPEFEIDIASNGKVAINKLKTQTYDLILMDIQMPKMDGYETTRYIRNKLKPPHSEIPILAMTAHAIEGESQKCLDAGMNDYIAKPIVADLMYTKIVQLMTPEEVSPQPKDKPKQVASVPLNTAETVVDLDRLKDLTDGNIDMMETYISIFLKNIPNDVEYMLDLLNAKDWDELKVIAHKIKGNASYMGIKRLGTIIPIIENNCVEGTNLDEIPPLVKQVAQICNKAIKELEIIKDNL